jgi:hypothetical protein
MLRTQRTTVNARPTSVRAVPVNVTTTTDIGQPRSLSTRQTQELKGSFSFLHDFYNMSQFESSRDFGTHSSAKLLPVDTTTSHLLNTSPQAINPLNCANTQDFKLSKTQQNVIDSSLGNDKKITTLFTLQDIDELSADVRQALHAAAEGEKDPCDFFAAAETAACLATRSQKLVESRLGEIAAQVQFDQVTAQKWAAQCYGTQNTLVGDSPAAAAFQLAKASEPKTAVPVAVSSAWPKPFKGSGGQGRGRAVGRGVRNTPRAEQVSGPGADKAPGRPQ